MKLELDHWVPRPSDTFDDLYDRWDQLREDRLKAREQLLLVDSRRLLYNCRRDEFFERLVEIGRETRGIMNRIKVLEMLQLKNC
jgi:hypothetical protein